MSSRRPEEIPYRAGTHATFKGALLARLGAIRRPDGGSLVASDDADLTIALLDGFATMADVLTFYQERLANEAYLPTATDLTSVLELTAITGYRLRPGLAASTYLAFDFERAGLVEAGGIVNVDPGFRVQSLPVAGEVPRTFETSQSLAAIPELSKLAPVTTVEQHIDETTRAFVVRGVATRLQRGDAVALVVAGKPQFLVIDSVTTDSTLGQTTITTLGTNDRDVTTKPPDVTTEGPATISQAVIRRRALHVANGGTPDFAASVAALVPRPLVDTAPALVALGTRANFFGHNAADFKSMPDLLRERYSTGFTKPTDWPPKYPTSSITSSDENTSIVHASVLTSVGASGEPGVPDTTVVREAKPIPLDRQYTVAADTYVAIAWPQAEHAAPDVTIAKVSNVRDGTFNAFAMSGASTFLDCGDTKIYPTGIDDVRGARIFLQSDELQFVPLLVRGDLATAKTGQKTITVDGSANIPPARRVIVSDSVGGEPAIVATASVGRHGGTSVTNLSFEPELSRPYDLATLIVYANVVRATHGESVREILGSGDANVPSQFFTLRHAPLTFVRDDTVAGGRASTLGIRVGGLAWREVTSLLDGGPRDHVFSTSITRDGTVSIRFGDGVHGSRLPTGTDNIEAFYRYSSGGEGGIDPFKITLALSRPLGFRGVTNPVAAGGGLNADDLESARRNAAAATRSLERAVTLEDVGDLTNVLGGFVKTSVDVVTRGGDSVVVVSVAGADGKPLDSDFLTSIEGSLRDQSQPGHAISVVAAAIGFFAVAAAIVIAPGSDAAATLRAVRDALETEFSSANRDVGQSVFAEDIYATMHGVEGVLGVDLKAFDRLANARATGVILRKDVLHASGVSLDENGASVGREILIIDKESLATGVVLAGS